MSFPNTTPKPEFCPSMFTPRSFLVLLIATLFYTCQNENPIKQDYEAIEKGSARLRETGIFVLDSLHSVIKWTAKSDDGQFVQGVIHPNVGTLLLEKERVVGGYWEGHWSKGEVKDHSPVLNPDKLMQILIDSNIRLGRNGGKKFRFEISQSNRQVVRTDFKVTQEDSTISRITHQFMGNLLFADSILYATLPVRLEIQPGAIKVDGSYKLNFNDFGVNWKPTKSNSTLSFRPPVLLDYSLVFQPFGNK